MSAHSTPPLNDPNKLNALDARAALPGEALSALASVTDDGRINLPPDFQLAAVRYGKRRDPLTGTTQTQLALLLVKHPVASIVLTFVPGQNTPALEIRRDGRDRFTDIQLVDFAGNNNHHILGLSAKSQDVNKADIFPAFEVFDPATGQPVVARTPITFSNDLGAAAFQPPPPGMPRCGNDAPGGPQGPPCRPDMKTDVDGAFITRIGNKEVVAIVPQTSFLVCCFTSDINTFVYFLYSPDGTTNIRVKPVEVRHIAGNPLERNMAAFGVLEDVAGARKKFVVMSKSLVFTFDVRTDGDGPSLLTQMRRQFSDPQGTLTALENSRDVPDHPNFPTCSITLDRQRQCTAQGRRYGQFRIMRVGEKQRLVVAAHSVSGGFPPNGLVPLYTVYRNPLTEGSTPFLAPIGAWSMATTDLDPSNTHPFRQHYRYFNRAKKKRTLGLTAYANGEKLYRGTPTNGMAQLTGAGGPPYIVVSSARNPEPFGPDGFPPPGNPRFEIVQATDGRTPDGLTLQGAIALDVVQQTNTSLPARILAWGDLIATQTPLTFRDSYRDGQFEVYALEGSPLALRRKFRRNDEPVLLDFGTLNRPPEDLGVSGENIAVFNAVVRCNNIQAALTFPRTKPTDMRARFVNAYDLDGDAFTQRLSEADLEGSLFAVVSPSELPLRPAVGGSIIGGSTLVILDGSTLSFKGVAPSASGATWQLVRGVLAGSATPPPPKAKEKEGKESKEAKETKEGKDTKDKESKETKEGKDTKDKEGKETKEGKEIKEGKDFKDKEGKESKEKEVKEGKESKDFKDKEGKESKEGKDFKDKEGKEAKDKEVKEGKEGKDFKDKEGKETKEGKDTKDKEAKEGKEAKDFKEPKEPKESKEKDKEFKESKDRKEGKEIFEGGEFGFARESGADSLTPQQHFDEPAQGRAFITSEERPPVGERVLSSEEEGAQ